jgi:hypothetical protein
MGVKSRPLFWRELGFPHQKHENLAHCLGKFGFFPAKPWTEEQAKAKGII